MSDSVRTLAEPFVHDTISRRSRGGAICIHVFSVFIGFCLGCAVLQIDGRGQRLTTDDPAITVAWSAPRPASRLSPLFAFPSVLPASRLPPRVFQARPSVLVHSTAQNMQNRPRQQVGSESSYIDDDFEKEAAAEEAAAAAALEASKKLFAESESKVVEAPYSINIFVQGDNTKQFGVEASDYKKGTAKFGYMENKINTALENTVEKIKNVEVRLTVEGHKPKTYRMEATVKFVDHHKERTMVVSQSSHAKGSFIEEVDVMHDLLKKQMRKEKEKYMSKIKHARKDLQKAGEAEAVVEDPEDDVMVPP